MRSGRRQMRFESRARFGEDFLRLAEAMGGVAAVGFHAALFNIFRQFGETACAYIGGRALERMSCFGGLFGVAFADLDYEMLQKRFGRLPEGLKNFLRAGDAGGGDEPVDLLQFEHRRLYGMRVGHVGFHSAGGLRTIIAS